MMRALRCSVVVIATLLLGGCIQSVPPPKPVEEGQYLVHIVTGKGDTLPRVVQWYTGLKYVPQEVLALNTGIGGRPLRPGDKVLIPTKLLARTDAPFVPKSVKGQKSGLKGKKASAAGRTKGSSAIAEPQASPKSQGDSGAQEPPRGEESQQVSQTGQASEPPPVASPESRSVSTTSVPPVAVSAPGGAEADSSKQPPRVDQSAKTANANTPKGVEDLLKEEQAELERLKGELGEPR